MQTRSFFQMFRGMLTLITVGTIGMLFQIGYVFSTQEFTASSVLLLCLAVYFIVSFANGLRERDFRDWNKVVLEDNTLTGYTLFGKKLTTVSLAPGNPVYWAVVWVPKERGMGESILVLSNSPFTLPVNGDQLFRTVFDRTRQLLVVGAPDHPSLWFPNTEFIEVNPLTEENIML